MSKQKSNIYSEQLKYERWWLNKRCRISQFNEFKKVVRINLHGSPSFVYGTVELICDDGSVLHPGDPYCFKPRKYHVEVEE